MKTFTYFIVSFLFLTTLNAGEIARLDTKADGAKLSITTLDFDKRGVAIPGVTLNLTPLKSIYKKFTVTLAHNLFKSANSLFEKANPMETALYAQLSFRF